MFSLVSSWPKRVQTLTFTAQLWQNQAGVLNSSSNFHITLEFYKEATGCFLRVASLRAACLQDVGDHPDGPAVHSFAVGFLGEDLRSWGWRQRHQLAVHHHYIIQNLKIKRLQKTCQKLVEGSGSGAICGVHLAHVSHFCSSLVPNKALNRNLFKGAFYRALHPNRVGLFCFFLTWKSGRFTGLGKKERKTQTPNVFQIRLRWPRG